MATCGHFFHGVYSGRSPTLPPFGNRRFQPQRVEAWSGVRDALAFGPMLFAIFPAVGCGIPEHPPVRSPERQRLVFSLGSSP